MEPNNEIATTIERAPRTPGLRIYSSEDRPAILARLRDIVTTNRDNDPQLIALTIMSAIDALDLRPLWAIDASKADPVEPSA